MLSYEVPLPKMSDETHTLHAVGSPKLLPMVLLGEHDHRQMWFPFVFAVMVQKVSRVGFEPADQWRWSLRVRQEQALITVEGRMYDHKRHVDQIGLPFAEFLHIPMEEIRLMRNNGYPGFEVMNGKYAIFVHHYGFDIRGLTNWCLENCRDRFSVMNTAVYFMSFRDATLAQLAFMLENLGLGPD